MGRSQWKMVIRASPACNLTNLVLHRSQKNKQKKTPLYQKLRICICISYLSLKRPKKKKRSTSAKCHNTSAFEGLHTCKSRTFSLPPSAENLTTWHERFNKKMTASVGLCFRYLSPTRQPVCQKTKQKNKRNIGQMKHPLWNGTLYISTARKWSQKKTQQCYFY